MPEKIKKTTNLRKLVFLAQKNAYFLADILVTASINKDELENIESFIESKSKDALYVLLNHVV